MMHNDGACWLVVAGRQAIVGNQPAHNGMYLQQRQTLGTLTSLAESNIPKMRC